MYNENNNNKISTRNSKKRNLILNIINNSSTPISAKQIYAKVIKSNNNIDLSTIYRTLAYLTKNNIITKQISNTKVTLYEPINHIHKHKIICDICKKSEIIAKCPLKDIQNNLSDKTGFKITSHTFEIHGICKKCQMRK